MDVSHPNICGTQQLGLLRYLTKGRPYRFRVAAETVVGTGPYTSVFQQAPSWMDETPPENATGFSAGINLGDVNFGPKMDVWMDVWWFRTSLGVDDGNMTWDGVGMR